MTSDSPTEEALYGDLVATRDGPGGFIRIVFRPVSGDVTKPAGCTVPSTEDLNAVLNAIGLSVEQITRLSDGLENSEHTWVRVLATTAVLRQNSLI